MNSYLSKYFHSAASSAISSIAESVAYRYWNTFSSQVNFSSFLCPDYHHSSSIITGSMCSSQELLIGGVCGGLGSPWSPFLFQRLLVVFPKLGLQLLSVVKEVHELNLYIDLWFTWFRWRVIPSPMDATYPEPNQVCYLPWVQRFSY